MFVIYFNLNKIQLDTCKFHHHFVYIVTRPVLQSGLALQEFWASFTSLRARSSILRRPSRWYPPCHRLGGHLHRHHQSSPPWVWPSSHSSNSRASRWILLLTLVGLRCLILVSSVMMLMLKMTIMVRRHLVESSCKPTELCLQTCRNT